MVKTLKAKPVHVGNITLPWEFSIPSNPFQSTLKRIEYVLALFITDHTRVLGSELEPAYSRGQCGGISLN